MSMQRYPRNPIEARKTAVRTYSRNAAVCVGGGVVGGIALGLLFTSWTWLTIGLVVAVGGGGYYWSRIRKIVNHKDQY